MRRASALWEVFVLKFEEAQERYRKRRLTAEDEHASAASFSPDGSLIASHHEPEDGTYPHNCQIAVMRRDGGDRRILTASLDRQCDAVAIS